MLAIRAGQMIDGNGGRISEAVVLVEGERILEVGPAASVVVPPAAEVIDARSQTLLPGMIDAHCHIHTPGGPVKPGSHAADELGNSQGLRALRAARYARQALRMGFTSLRTVHSPAYLDLAVRDAVNDGFIEGPRIRAAGQGLTITGGHMDDKWAPEVSVDGITGVSDGPWGMRRAARMQIKRGVDLIKINAAVSWHGQDFTGKLPYHPEMTYDEMAAICEEAHWAGKTVAAHAYGGQGLDDALRAGIDSVDHGPWLTDANIEWMVEHDVFYVPTMTVYAHGLALGAEGAGTSEAGREWLRLANEAKLSALARAHAAGVKIAVGTDAGFWVRHGENASELEEMVNGGLTPMEAIVAATRTGAECLGISRDAGTVERGKFADLVLVAGDPLKDIRILQDPECIAQVFKGGKRVAAD
jgi:imidazolonepropionase-like amidohydrolase